MRAKNLWTVAVGLWCGVASAQEAPTPTWTLEEGQTLRYAFTWDLQQSEEIPDVLPPQEISIQVRYVLAQTVTSLDATHTATIHAEVAEITAVVDLGLLGSLEYTGDDDPDNPLHGLRHLVGRSFTYHLSPHGEVSHVDGGAAIVQAVQAQVEAPAGGGDDMGMMDPDALGRGLVVQVAAFFADDALTSSLGVVNAVLPGEDQGVWWERHVEERVPQVGELSFDAAYALGEVGPDGTPVTFAASGEVDLERAATSENAMGDLVDKMSDQATGDTEVEQITVSGEALMGPSTLRRSEIEHVIVSWGPLPDMFASMLGDDAEGKRMRQTVSLRLRYTQE